MNERYLTSFEDQTAALGYTSGDTTLVSPQVSLVGANEVVYSKEIPNGSRIRFAKNETTGKLYFIVDGVYYDALTLKKTEIPVITYGEVDLGLPSGLKWADRNVGAKTPQDNGAYFSWGNVEGVVSNGITKMSEDDLIEQLIIIFLRGEFGVEATPDQIEETKNNPEMMDVINQMISMVISGEYILIGEHLFDPNTYPTTLGGQYTGSTLDAEHDAATVNMGSDWRMPTKNEIDELVEITDHYYIGEDGSIVSESELDDSKKLRSICFVKKGEEFNYDNRSNFIEFPFAGECFGSLSGYGGLYGYVWSSSVDERVAGNACSLTFESDGYLSDASNNSNNRFLGLSVRGVRS